MCGPGNWTHVIQALYALIASYLDKDDPDDNTGDDPNSHTTEVEIQIGKKKEKHKVNKKIINPACTINIIKAGQTKMEKMNLPAIRHRKKLRMAREKKAIGDALYNELMNIDGISEVETVVNVTNKQDDGALFATWDNLIRSLI